MTWSDFYQVLSGGKPGPAYVFAGEEEYIKREALQALRDLLLPPGLEALNDVTLEGATARQIIEAAETLPVMCEKRVVAAVDWPPLLSKGKADASELEAMKEWLRNPPDTCVVVFYLRAQGEEPRKGAGGPLEPGAETVRFDALSPAELTRWCAQRLKPQGKKIAANALNALTLRAGTGLTRLSAELDKLSAYAGERREITVQDVDALVTPSLEDNIFKLMDYLLSGDMAAAQRLIRELTQHGQTPVGILATLAGNLRLMAHIQCALDAGGNLQQVQAQLKLNPYRAKILARQCGRFTAEKLTGLFELYVDLDAAVKGGRFRDRDALDKLVFAIVGAKR